MIKMRLKSLFFTTVLALSLAFQSCKINDTGFETFVKSFAETNLPIIIDSAFLSSLNTEDKEYLILETELLELSQIDQLLEKHGELPMYEVNLLSKVTLGKSIQGLIYVVRLNPKIPFDVKMKKVLLGIYDEDGKLIDSKEIGGFEYHFGNDKMTYSTLTSDLTLSMIYSDKKTVVSSGVSEVTKSRESYKINSEGKFIKL
jgi:hypothetical protein